LKNKIAKHIEHGNTELQTATAQVLNNDLIRTQVPLSEVEDDEHYQEQGGDADSDEDDDDEDDDDDEEGFGPSGETSNSHMHIGGRLNLKPSFSKRSMNKFELPSIDSKNKQASEHPEKPAVP